MVWRWRSRALAGAAFVAALAACARTDDTRLSIAEAAAEPCRLLDVGAVEEALETSLTAARDLLAVGALRRRGCEYGLQADVDEGSGAYGIADTGWRPKASISVLPRAEVEQSLARPVTEFDQVGGLGARAFFVPPHESLLVFTGDVTLVVDVGRYVHAHGTPAAHDRLRASTRQLAETALARLDRGAGR